MTHTEEVTNGRHRAVGRLGRGAMAERYRIGAHWRCHGLHPPILPLRHVPQIVLPVR